MHASGFSHCPVSRFLVYSTVISAIIVTATDTKYYFPLSINLHILEYGQWWRLLVWQLCYVNSTEVLFAAMTFYHLRIIERLWGSRKFLSFLITTLPYITLLPPLVIFLLRPLSFNMLSDLYLPSGPTAMIFSILAQYHAMVPYMFRYRISSSSGGGAAAAAEAKGVELTSKSWSYLLPAQLALSQLPSSLVPALVGWCIGYAWRLGILPGVDWRVPGFFGRRNTSAGAGRHHRHSTPAATSAAHVAVPSQSATTATTTSPTAAARAPTASSSQMSSSNASAGPQDAGEGSSRRI